jgi:ribosomal-protein-serine acetyltransferase
MAASLSCALPMADEGAVRLHVRYPARIPVDEEVELRIVADDDAAAIFALTNRNRAYLRRWLPWVDNTRSVADTRAFIERSGEQVLRGQGFQSCILYRGELVGVIGFVYVDVANGRAELGYWISEAAQGRGIMTRACGALVRFAFESLGLNRVEIRVDVDNRKSRAVPERLGFVQEAVLREAAVTYERYIDVVMYALLRRSWGTPATKAPAKPLEGEGAVPPRKE